MLVAVMIVGIRYIGVGIDPLSSNCGCTHIAVSECVESNATAIRSALDKHIAAEPVCLILCTPGDYTDVVNLNEIEWMDHPLTIWADTGPVTLSPAALSNHWAKITFGDVKGTWTPKKITFVENETLEVFAAEFARDVDVCTLSVSSPVVFQTLDQAEEFLNVNTVLPSVALREEFDKIYLFGDNVSVVAGTTMRYVNDSIGSTELYFYIASTGPLGTQVFGGAGRAVLEIVSNSQLVLNEPSGYVKIRNSHSLTCVLNNTYPASLDYYGAGTLDIYSNNLVENMTGKFTLTDDFVVVASDDCRVVFEEVNVVSNVTFRADIPETLIDELNVGGFVEVVGITEFGRVNILEDGVLQFNYGSWSSDGNVTIDYLNISAGENATAALEFIAHDHYRTDYSHRVALAAIGSLSVSMSETVREYMWARLTLGSGETDRYYELCENIALENENVKVKATDSWISNPNCEDLFNENCIKIDMEWTIYRYSPAPVAFIVLFTLTGVVDLALGIPAAIWAFKHQYEIFET